MEFCIDSKLKRSSGIYRIVCKVTGKIYIGSASDFLHRYNGHLTDFRREAHSNSYLLKAYLKYGPESFSFELVELCSREELIHREQYHLDLIKSYEPDLGYNICKTAGRIDMTDEIRAKIGDANRGHEVSEETRQKLSQKNKGRKHTPEALAKIRAAAEKRKGVKRPEEVRVKISTAKKASGRKHSEEAKQKMREAFEANREKRLAQLEKVWESRRLPNSR